MRTHVDHVLTAAGQHFGERTQVSRVFDSGALRSEVTAATREASAAGEGRDSIDFSPFSLLRADSSRSGKAFSKCRWKRIHSIAWVCHVQIRNNQARYSKPMNHPSFASAMGLYEKFPPGLLSATSDAIKRHAYESRTEFRRADNVLHSLLEQVSKRTWKL